MYHYFLCICKNTTQLVPVNPSSTYTKQMSQLIDLDQPCATR